VLIVEHELYRPDEHDWDMALIRLSTPLTYDDFVQPICLPSTPVPTGTNCIVAGWGRTDGAYDAGSMLNHCLEWTCKSER